MQQAPHPAEAGCHCWPVPALRAAPVQPSDVQPFSFNVSVDAEVDNPTLDTNPCFEQIIVSVPVDTFDTSVATGSTVDLVL